jgi:hypothetical protein
MIKKTKIPPSRLFPTREKVTRATLIPFSINSRDISINKMFLRINKPKKPMPNKTKARIRKWSGVTVSINKEREKN